MTVPISVADGPSIFGNMEEAPEIKRNQYGGIHVNKADIETVFKYVNPTMFGRVNHSELRHKISLFDRELKSKDFTLLMTGRDDLTIDELYEILKNNELENYDPVREAFKYLDPTGRGYANMERVREMF